MGNGSGTLRIGKEVRDAGDDAHVGLRANILQRGREALLRTTVDQLTSLDKRTSSAGVPIDVVLHVRIPDDGEEKRHHEDQNFLFKLNTRLDFLMLESTEQFLS